MKALVKEKAGPGLTMKEVPVPEPGINDVLIQVHKSSICGTDVHIYKWDAWAQKTIKPPLVVGHEFAGKVAAVGSNVKGFKPGDTVSGEGHVVCGLCRNCMAGRRHLCAHTLGVGVQRDGAFAEYLCIPMTNVWYADPHIPMELLAYFDPLGNATHTALSFDLVGEDVLITGAGPIGCMAAAIARHCGARYVVVTDVNEYRLALAKKLGATVAVNVSKQKLEDVQKELGMHEGFDVGMEMSGNPQAFESMLENMAHGGRIALLGILPSMAGVDWDQVIFKGLLIKGIYGREMYETWYKMTAMIRSGLDVLPVLTHKFPIARYEEAFQTMIGGQSGKIVMEWQ
ncbi:MAG: L-threonine 3-dehydrogenase [Planctomycetota bacterium]|nr:L-threonine 3-dehydrogenase [Planctomycetota bacterium]